MWITRLIDKQKPLFKGHEWTQSRQLSHFGMIRKMYWLSVSSVERFANKMGKWWKKFSHIEVCESHSGLKWSDVAQPCPSLYDPTDTRLLRPWDFPGKSTGVGCHFLLQGTSRPRDRTQVSHIVDRHFTIWATREVWLGLIWTLG